MIINPQLLVSAQAKFQEVTEREQCEESLYAFLKKGWKYIDPAPFVGGWHLEAIAEHLQAVTDGQIRRLLINVPPRTSKPVAHDAWVLSRRGLIRLSEVIVGDEVWTHRGRWRAVTAIHDQGLLPILRITTRSGRVVEAAADHPFLTPDGWVEMGQLQPDDVVGIVPCREDCGQSAVTEMEARLLGYFVGDGACKAQPNITCADDAVADDIQKCAASLGFATKIQTYRMASTGHMLRRIVVFDPKYSKRGAPIHTKSGIRLWLERHGIFGMSSYTKMIPPEVMSAPNAVIRAFLGAYWSCDGCIAVKGAKRDGVERDDLEVRCDSVNRPFLEQIQIALTRLGINSGIFTKVAKIKTKKQGDTYTSHCLRLSAQDDVWRFAQQVELLHHRVERMKNAKKRRFDFDRSLWGASVASITASGEKHCICLTVEEDSSFTANGFAVHNSSICSVAWPAWTWAQKRIGPNSGPQVQFLSASYAQSLSLRDSVKTRRLIESPFYQKYWGSRFSMTSDVNTKGRYENNKGGYRIATSVDGTLTGEGSQVILVDDAHSATEVESDLVRTSTLQWWDEALSTRLNDPNTGAFVVIMQRLHQEDLTGHIIRREGADWTWLMLPMEHEKSRHCITYVNGAKFWEDPRTEEGELLCPDRFTKEAVANLSKRLGDFASAGQLQQSPVPRGGGLIKEEWWQQWTEPTYPPFSYIIASLDTAYTEKEENDASALTIWGVFQEERTEVSRYGNQIVHKEHPKIMLIHGFQERLALPDLVERVKVACSTMKLPANHPYANKPRFKVDKLIIESKASGLSVYQELQRVIGFSGQFSIELFNPTKLGDKWARVYSVQHLFSEGLVYVPWPKEKDGPNKGQAGPLPYKWVEEIMDQITIFPRGAHDDYVDSMSMGLRYLRDSGVLLRNEEHAHDIQEEGVYRGRAAPLYPV